MSAKPKKESTEMPNGITCKCGKLKAFSPYVYAHWDMPLVFTCQFCGARYNLLRGTATEIKNTK